LSLARFRVTISAAALGDIQEGIDYYNNQQSGLGNRFEDELNSVFELFESNPFFAIRYDNVHCVPLKIFPFMIHYTILESASEVRIHAVIHTHKNPTRWGGKKR
jgi:toxin ParE1/3/4